MNTAHFLLLIILLITSLVALTILLIVVTEQPDSILESRHHRIVHERQHFSKRLELEKNKVDQADHIQAVQTEKEELDDVPEISPIPTRPDNNFLIPNTSPSAMEDLSDGILYSWKEWNTTSGAPQKALHLQPSNSTPPNSSFSIIDVPLVKLAEFGPAEGGKFMGIQLVNNSALYLPKDDGRVEVRDPRALTLLKMINVGTRIHRAKVIGGNVLVILDSSFKRLILFEAETKGSRGRVLRELYLQEAAKELAFDDALFTLARHGSMHIDEFELDELRPVPLNGSMEVEEERNCNAIVGDGRESLLVACESGILAVSKHTGSVMRRLSASSFATFSALLPTMSERLLAGNRAQRVIHLLDQNSGVPIARLHHNRGVGTIWLWTSLALYNTNNGTLRLFTLEYISNRVEVFELKHSDCSKLLLC